MRCPDEANIPRRARISEGCRNLPSRVIGREILLESARPECRPSPHAIKKQIPISNLIQG